MYLRYFIPASNESSAVLTRAFDECREGQYPAACCGVIDLFYHSLFISAELFHKIPYKLHDAFSPGGFRLPQVSASSHAHNIHMGQGFFNLLHFRP
jgi:hypothetical protein